MTTAEPITPPPATQRQDPRPHVWSPAEFARMSELGIFADEVELIAGTVCFAGQGDPEPFHFRRKEYYALSDEGFFRDQRVQLIRGVILREEPMNPPHAMGIQLVAIALGILYGAGFSVRVQLPLDLGQDTEPEPDVAVVRGSPRDYPTHPTTAVLVVEVSDSTLASDLTVKAELYAATGIPEYWVLDLETQRLLVFRDPVALAPGGHAYHTHLSFAVDESVTPLAATNPVAVADLLP